jgi:hypothetical protein
MLRFAPFAGAASEKLPFSCLYHWLEKISHLLMEH